MQRRDFLRLGLATAPISIALGCRSHQFGHVINDNQADMVGSHTAGAETFKPLINKSVAKLLGRQETQLHSVAFNAGPPAPKRICFVCVENRSIEELGDFKDQIYEQIDSQILQAQMFDPISRRFVDSALYETRLRPDALFVPENMRLFMAALEQQGQPFDYLLYATLTSGTTENNQDYQRDYLLTLEMVNVHTGQYDKESAKVRKGYHHSRAGKWMNYNPFTRQS
ncbi:MAG: penicillin-binding protein activator LpoB [Planctomycetes bacterium]|nr:penicillin-binding protein activator LpoB [Planctomycetota bacterium]